ncbi:hypothetical protein N0B31_03760 [Salinirubellus salinus]|uniref:Uncharacterized protein n=1 Tax=Salinirubellus salinus TaxID=1364945 RepID=A0A9E7R669_9EURY|nr:hypothetical protein [Salinirubellus salinus]UWM55405.1 hypothetical protein N0B31_03760 [Salinirubellus salinus]
MSGTPDRPSHESAEDGSGVSALGHGSHRPHELANAIEWNDVGEGLCYIYPADADDSELKAQWLAVPACLLLDLEDAR